MKTRQQKKSSVTMNEKSMMGEGGELVSAAQRNLKRAALEQDGKSQKRTRTFGDITNAMSNNLVIDSSKKGKSNKLTALKQKAHIPLPTHRRGTRRSRTTSANDLNSVQEHSSSSEDVSMAEVSPSESSSTDQNSSSEIEAPVPITIHDPCPEYDYDNELGVDPFNVPDYARGIFYYLKSRESLFRAEDYMARHNKLSKPMRTILIDWMVEVQENFELNHETLYLGVKLTDLHLSRVPPIAKEDLQLIGSTALFIAAKYEERMAPCCDDFLYICDDAYTKDQLLAMERNILSTIGFDLGCPLSYRFLRRYAKVSKVNMELLTLARYILESSLLHYEFVQHSDSLMAASAFLLACRMRNAGDWTTIQEKYTGFLKEEVEPLMWKLNSMLRTPTPSNIKTVFDKYSHEVFFEVAKIAPLLEK